MVVQPLKEFKTLLLCNKRTSRSNHPATPPRATRNAAQDPQVFGTQADDQVVPFEAAFLPAKPWGHAGRAPYSEQNIAEE
ncbi:hypothetical protein F442_23215 [Phytophthora nicotianae P10297]|uniref:Uncharacterized protein n=2 Tax=Phytophthora nicotianae TaxID=4792 RepID=V9EDJ3_PHYNI|nr:hypothetical protein F443_17349 [Phytophthora nicotianae P1569]ETP27508.1 hypothetical protein F442_23215 [Phytophthora nicotianae P10297]